MSTDWFQITTRLRKDTVPRMDAVAKALTRPGQAPVTRADALRYLLELGLEKAEAEFGLTPQKPSKKGGTK